ncbi:glutathione S-transferase [Halieaceae bacterium IMCC14734]|uniref:Glutathione S-transferase n=1 Tax=Candidatus Litorirhabdus singularis TaxID=2518993 RepID=A0ABT3TGV6_9GAMM|nr:glutathione S-transferase N-terminal domain-containing protein [Candidatus Litorirhabdus singularis]MCX2981551.1 glutathione S-transferase [Candidatus Litorirhabdus singularis]
MPGPFNLLTSTLASAARGWTGIRAQPLQDKPPEPLVLYDMENCPYCRLVREVLTELDLDAVIYPSPKRGQRFRPELVALAGKAQFPYLVDPNTDVSLYESLDIIAYLFETYGNGDIPMKWRLGALQTVSSMLASGARGSRGLSVKASRQPEQLLELYSFEGSPYARPVRELLCQLELPYLLRNCGRSELGEWLPPVLRERLELIPDSQLPNRIKLQQEQGRMGIPFLWDPNTGTGLFESDAIVDYLSDNYAV